MYKRQVLGAELNGHRTDVLDPHAHFSRHLEHARQLLFPIRRPCLKFTGLQLEVHGRKRVVNVGQMNVFSRFQQAAKHLVGDGYNRFIVLNIVIIRFGLFDFGGG